MPSPLDQFETTLEQKLSKIDEKSGCRAGVLLPHIPSRNEWDVFLVAARESWDLWRKKPEAYPACLVVLYGGLAFFEYEDASFWPQFSAAVGCLDKTPPLSLYNKLNRVYCEAVTHWRLKLIGVKERTSYVGSAVHHIGIPLSFWGGFLDLCEWAVVQEEWKNIPKEEWDALVTRLSGSRRRLRAFLIGNRESAAQIIVEMLDARQCLASDPTLTIEQLKHVCFLRPEYFDEVPETAEFLRPNDPESLFRDRPRLAWDERRGGIVLHLPGVEREKLPATWSIGGKEFPAAGTPDGYAIHAAAFCSSFPIKLWTEKTNQEVRLSGAKPWALFDMERDGYYVNSSRDHLPLRGYVLVSPEKVLIKREGFEVIECPENESYVMSDGISCFITRLFPKDRFASLTVGEGVDCSVIRFRTRKRIEARFFVGHSWRSARFTRYGDQLNLEELPIVCVLVPIGYFPNTREAVNKNFKVLIDKRQADGRWESRGEALEDYELFDWNWSKRPFLDQVKSGRVKDFGQLKEFFRPPDLKGKRILSVEAPGFGIRFSYSLYIESSKMEVERCWSNLPGKFLPWFLLAQSQDGWKWDELGLVSFILAREAKLSYFLFKKYADAGLFVQKGRRWTIAESRANLTQPSDNLCTLSYCGDPSILWGLYKKMFHLVIPKGNLPMVCVVDGRGVPPFLQMSWPSQHREDITRHLRSRTVCVVGNLWNP